MSRVLKTGDIVITNSYENHKGWSHGVDVRKKSGDKTAIEDIVAHTEGEVIKVVDYMTGTNGQPDKEAMGYGNYVMILHDNKYLNKYVVTNYAHLAYVAADIKSGVRVLTAHFLGGMGNTGNSYGEHLHFEIRLYHEKPQTDSLHDISKFEWLDPTPYLNADLPKDETVPLQLERVQIGAFGVLNNAVRQAKAVTGKGYAAIIKKYNDIYRVQVGAYSNHANAVNMLNKMKSLGYDDAYITTESGVDVEFG